MQKYENLARFLPPQRYDWEMWVNKVAADGWELVTVYDGIAFFKRPVQ